jgi:peptidylprolyl isomerase
VSRRTTHTTRLAVLLAVPALLMSACGEDTGGDEGSGEGLSTVTISGEFGKEPKVTWDGTLDPDELESEVLVTGDGPEVEDGQQVFTRLWLGNGFTEEVAYSTFGKDDQPELLTAGDAFSKAISTALDGHTIGSRIAVAAPPKDAFGDAGNAQLGIGNKDPVLFVVDLIGLLPDGPSGKEKEPASWAPEVVGEDEPTGLDFSGTPEPDGKLRLTTLIDGGGAPTEKGQTLYVDYLGQVHGAKEPFDASYDGQAFSFPLGGGQVVKGWDKLLEGVPVGSRVLIAVPPAQGYGEEGNKDAGIKGTDTLYFVIDVLSAL